MKKKGRRVTLKKRPVKKLSSKQSGPNISTASTGGLVSEPKWTEGDPVNPAREVPEHHKPPKDAKTIGGAHRGDEPDDPFGG